MWDFCTVIQVLFGPVYPGWEGLKMIASHYRKKSLKEGSVFGLRADISKLLSESLTFVQNL